MLSIDDEMMALNLDLPPLTDDEEMEVLDQLGPKLENLLGDFRRARSGISRGEANVNDVYANESNEQINRREGPMSSPSRNYLRTKRGPCH